VPADGSIFNYRFIFFPQPVGCRVKALKDSLSQMGELATRRLMADERGTLAIVEAPA